MEFSLQARAGFAAVTLATGADKPSGSASATWQADGFSLSSEPPSPAGRSTTYGFHTGRQGRRTGVAASFPSENTNVQACRRFRSRGSVRCLFRRMGPGGGRLGTIIFAQHAAVCYGRRGARFGCAAERRTGGDTARGFCFSQFRAGSRQRPRCAPQQFV